MDMFDETFISQQGIVGGRSKKQIMISQDIRCVELTGRPQLDALLAELTEVIAPRYQKVPDESIMTLYENMIQGANLSDEVLKAAFPFLW